MKRFEGRTALVTGGAGSIGWAAAQRFCKEGARVVLADLDGDRAGELAGTLREATGIGANVADEDGAEAAVRAAMERFGRLDIVFNNAGTRDRSVRSMSCRRTSGIMSSQPICAASSSCCGPRRVQ